MSTALIALKPLRYAGRAVACGEVFDVDTDLEVKLLTTIGFGLPPDRAALLPEPVAEPMPAKRGRGRPRRVS